VAMRKLDIYGGVRGNGNTHSYDSRLDRRGGEERTLLQPLRVYNLGGKSVRESGRNQRYLAYSTISLV
jgi:hypothetical protein